MEREDGAVLGDMALGKEAMVDGGPIPGVGGEDGEGEGGVVTHILKGIVNCGLKI